MLSVGKGVNLSFEVFFFFFNFSSLLTLSTRVGVKQETYVVAILEKSL